MSVRFVRREVETDGRKRMGGGDGKLALPLSSKNPALRFQGETVETPGECKVGGRNELCRGSSPRTAAGDLAALPKHLHPHLSPSPSEV